MEQPVRLNRNKGFTLIEVLVSMVIVLVLLLGLVQAALLSIDNNLRNVLRDEAVRIAEQRMNGVLIDKYNNEYTGLRDERFNDLVQTNWTCTAGDISRNFRSMTRDYAVCWQITDIQDSLGNVNVKILGVAVGWDYKGEVPVAQRPAPTNKEYQHMLSTIVRRPLL
ncbi:MAG: prepilin-type N-terminal cleavage/methylation domain-containing protein [Nitrospirota bacterium]